MTVQVTTLSNGIRVATDPVPTVETASLGVWIGVGTRSESPDLNGIAHMLEHMTFKGTPRRNAQAIAEEIEAVGGSLNAYTSREQTAYYAKVLKEDLPLALDVLADILQNSTMDEQELERERTVILQEIGQTIDTPDDIVFDHFQSAAFPGQAMGRPVLGTVDIVKQLTQKNLFDYRHAYYTGNNMVIAASGKVDHQDFVHRVEDLFSAVPAGATPIKNRAAYQGGDYREARALEQVHVVMGFEGASCHGAESYTQSILATLLGGGMSSRLFQEVREKRGLVYSIFSFASAYSDSGLFGFYAGTGEKDLPELIPVVCEEIAKAASTITEEEVDRARAQLRASVLMSQESTSTRCEQLAHQLLIYNRPLPNEEILGKIAAVDQKAVQQSLDRILKSKPTMAVIGPIASLEAYEDIQRRLTQLAA